MYSVTIDIAPNNWPGDDHARLVAACAGFHARMVSELLRAHPDLTQMRYQL